MQYNDGAVVKPAGPAGPGRPSACRASQASGLARLTSRQAPHTSGACSGGSSGVVATLNPTPPNRSLQTARPACSWPGTSLAKPSPTHPPQLSSLHWGCWPCMPCTLSLPWPARSWPWSHACPLPPLPPPPSPPKHTHICLQCEASPPAPISWYAHARGSCGGPSHGTLDGQAPQWCMHGLRTDYAWVRPTPHPHPQMPIIQMPSTRIDMYFEPLPSAHASTRPPIHLHGACIHIGFGLMHPPLIATR